jgi:hypothetical protein
MPSRVNVIVSGPIFDGEADAAVTQWLDDSRAKLAHQAQSIVQSKARKWNRSGRADHHTAAESVKVRPGAVYVVEGVSSKGQVWWPWLEGTSRRNATTRFKGYHAFRLAKGIVSKRARTTAQDELHKYIGRMGGGP